MNQIKYKVWDNKKKMWVEDVGIYPDGSLSIPYEQREENIDIVQYAGLKDKNGKGKEVYGGDMITFPYITPVGEIGDRENEYSYYGEVILENGSWFVKPIKSDDGFWNKQYLYDVIKQNGYVIGNIYENPNLTKSI